MKFLGYIFLIPMALGPATPYVFIALAITFGLGMLTGHLLF